MPIASIKPSSKEILLKLYALEFANLRPLHNMFAFAYTKRVSLESAVTVNCYAVLNASKFET